jgi:acetylglutamate kinase
MEQAIQKAAALIEALPYIQSFQCKEVVIKVGGAGMDDEKLLSAVLRDIVFMRVVGMHPVIVHGGGPFITRAMAKSGLKPTFVHGHRVTDQATLEIVERVLLGEVNWLLVRELQKLGGKAAPLHVRMVPFLRARRKQFEPEGGGAAVDIGYVGTIETVESAYIEELCQVGRIPVIAPMAVGPEGELLNINADDAAAKIAIAVNAEKLVFFTNVPGVLRNANDPASLFSTLREKDVETLIRDGVITGGMLPKVQSCLTAVQKGVRKGHIVDTGMPHSLLLEIFTDRGVGTEILK